MSLIFLDKDVKTQAPINQTAKSSKSQEVDGDSRFCGKRFILATKLYGDKKCLYCGKWFHWKDSDTHQFIREQNIDTTNLDSNVEPLHCGNSHCSDYHHRYLQAKEIREIQAEGDMESRMWRLYKNLKQKRII